MANKATEKAVDAPKVLKKKGTSKVKVKTEQKTGKKRGLSTGNNDSNELDNLNSEDEQPEDRIDIEYRTSFSMLYPITYKCVHAAGLRP